MSKHSTRMHVDIFVCIFFACIALCYNYRENLSPDRFLFVIQLCTFWFILRILVHFFPLLKTGMPYLILLAGLVEAIWGLGQLYGYFPSKHALFKTTGSFLNPGPYGGFIALMFPLALHYGLYCSIPIYLLTYAFFGNTEKDGLFLVSQFCASQ